MKLNQHEIDTPLWQKLMTHYEARIEKCRSRLESRCDADETARLRAQIAEIKAFFDLAQPDRKKETGAE
jgi:hypothetical protein